MDLMPFDELNKFREFVTAYKSEMYHTERERRQFRDDLEEYIEWLLIEAYSYGNVQARADLGLLDESRDYMNPDKIQAAIDKRVADKTAFERLAEYAEDDTSTVEDFQRVAETDATRVYNTAVLDTAEETKIPGIKKRWVTAEDDRVRDAHRWLDGVVVPLDAKFYVDGDSAYAPGGFSDPALNCNCRCEISLIRE
jgi:hypothetical protein